MLKFRCLLLIFQIMWLGRLTPETSTELQNQNHEHDKWSNPEPGNKTFDYFIKQWYKPEELMDPKSKTWWSIADSLSRGWEVKFTTQDWIRVDWRTNYQEQTELNQIQNDTALSNFEAAGRLLEVYLKVRARLIGEAIKVQEKWTKSKDTAAGLSSLNRID